MQDGQCQSKNTQMKSLGPEEQEYQVGVVGLELIGKRYRAGLGLEGLTPPRKKFRGDSKNGYRELQDN